jgi:hypothetical protein
MISQRPQRIRKPKVIWEAADNPRDHSKSQTASKAVRTTKQRAPAPIPVESLPILPTSLPSYTPQLKFRKKQGKPLCTNLTPIETFQKFIDIQIIQLVVENTNSYAARHRESNSLPQTRRWKPTTNGEIYRYIGVWLYMSMHHEALRQAYWSQTHQLGRYLPLQRFEQLHRYFSARDEAVYPQQQWETFAYKVEPIATILRQNCLANWSPGTHITIDEAIIAFRGRTIHKIKMKNKPIDEGYKIWMVAQHGYTLAWLWHSKQDGPEDIPKNGIEAPIRPSESVHLAPTYAIVIYFARLLRQLYPDQRFHFFIDNLFLTVPVAQALLFLAVL